MKRTRNDFSTSNLAAWLTIGLALAVCLVFFTGDGSGWARASIVPCYYDIHAVNQFAIVGSRYESSNTTAFPSSPVPVVLSHLDVWSPSPPLSLTTVPLPAPGGSATVTSFFDVFLDLNFFGPGSVPVEGTFGITGGGGSRGGDVAPDGTWPIELLSLNLAGNYPGVGPFMMRESPTLPSLGEHTLHPLPGTPAMPGGSLFIDSFFDVFFELSLDAGQTWHSAAVPVRMSLGSIIPEPGTTALVLLGAAGFMTAMRRRRR